MPKPLPQAGIDEEIRLLQAQVDRVREHNAFGDSNKDAIEAQIRVLQEQMDEDEILEAAELEEWEDNVKESAIEAARFWCGIPLDDNETLSEAWEPLCD